MKKKIKKYIFLINDITNVILKKDRIRDEATIHLLRKITIVVSICLVLSILLNIYLYLK